MEEFDAVHLKLEKGVYLVEASAGTGKTYAIAMLVLRFVAELGLEIDHILIVTFTRAATAELRARVRQRLVDGWLILSGESADADATLTAWAQTIPDAKRTEARIRLKLALANIDQAAVFTIHSFCQRMLREHALESSQPFDSELLTDTGAVVQEVVDDFWRENLYSVSNLAGSILREVAGTPEELLKTVSQAKGKGTLLPETMPPFAEAEDTLNAAVADFCEWWAEHGEELCDQYAKDEKAGLFNKKLKDGWPVLLDGLAQMRAGTGAPEDLSILDPEVLTEPDSGLLQKVKLRKLGKEGFCESRIFPPPETLKALIEALGTLKLSCRWQLAGTLRKEVRRRMGRTGSLSYDDLIHNVVASLKSDGGALLQESLAQRFGAALIDEFQDTDSDQYYIFSRLFVDGKHLLFLIGDPKQAIYSFRGADIHSYFQARSSADYQLTLKKNYRSHPRMVEGINQLFKGREKPFLYEEEKLPFYPVQALKETEIAGFSGPDVEEASGLEYWVLPEPENGKRWSSGKAQDCICAHLVAEISHLLTDDRWNISNNGENRPLVPQDIAILVRKNSVAADYVNALANAGIPAVTLSRDSVYASEECRELLLLLQAILEPSRQRQFKAGLALRWFGMNGQELRAVCEDEDVFGAWRVRMAEYQRQWREESFFAMMVCLLREEEVYHRLITQRRGERIISNIQQLLSLARDEAEDRRLGPLELFQWLRRRREDESREEAELLLESDEAAVQVVTMHKAKGLEYGIVFCPDLWRPIDLLKSETNQIVVWDGGDMVLDLGSKEFDRHREMARWENQAEALRLLYVAVTRAKLRCYVVWADCSAKGRALDSFLSPLSWLLFGLRQNANGRVTPLARDEQLRILQQAADGSGTGLRELENVPPQSVKTSPGGNKKLSVREVSRKLVTDWQRSSFSSLSRLSDYEHEGSSETAGEEGNTASIPLTGLPAGPHFGNLIHGLLEEHSFSELSQIEKNEKFVKRCHELSRRFGVQVETEKLALLLRNVMQGSLTPPEAAGECFSLAQIADTVCLKEMEFYMNLGHCEAADLGSLLAADPAVTSLRPHALEGCLTGFIDLLCEYDGRYYLLDYKSNYLGDRLADYEGESLCGAMRAHNYGLQYWIYTLVLHRWLGRRIENYNYAQHFGGVFYLFVRGMTPGGTGGIYTARPDEKLLREFDRITGK
ncbi:exodeoxyribonuclease V subunit beta [Desulforhopalus vacuolatus]|uniref:exodeoxyribonuclease V subunit beta n=1 Tax=Desulforhopalus vacuolatus TaxID=40414 RepID=UPI001962D891|nr:exodeoxyribonuclease V subunit beta [Desulforhopalus vacuolatus]MBM9518694.1 exodeoxyribonuclease V subunit beta [Desulforhopalus vacuolatus]